jgi:hypothetical protein
MRLLMKRSKSSLKETISRTRTTSTGGNHDSALAGNDLLSVQVTNMALSRQNPDKESWEKIMKDLQIQAITLDGSVPYNIEYMLKTYSGRIAKQILAKLLGGGLWMDKIKPGIRFYLKIHTYYIGTILYINTSGQLDQTNPYIHK